MSATRIVVGCGYLGFRVGKLWRYAGEHTWTITRTEDRVLELGMAGMLTAQGDVTNSESLERLSELIGFGGTAPEAMLFAIGFDRAAGGDIHSVYAGGLRNVLTALPASVTRAIYMSTTGVYGRHAGEWVDETTPPDPQREGGKASLAAERILAEHPLGRRSVILRLAGIYGPGRVPHLDLLRRGEPIAAPSEGWLNLIHVDDAARIVVAVDRWLADRKIADGPHFFCVSDGAPVIRREYYGEVARLIGAPPPTFAPPPADSPAAARAAVSRRVSNAKLRATLSTELAYPSYREGLVAILQDEASGGAP